MAKTSSTPAAMASSDMIRRPLRDVSVALPSLPLSTTGEPVFEEADAELLVRLAESAELVLQSVHGGVDSIGLLQAYAAEHIADGEIKATQAAALGCLLVELCEVLA